jgi:hypothetical protein
MLTKLTLLKPASKYLIIAECLDVITTAMGLSLGLSEGNSLLNQFPIQTILLFKMFATLIAVTLIQKINFGKPIIILPIIAIAPVFWNLYMLCLVTKIMYFGW